MITLLNHFYNEEYLLPFWLEHHKKIFDHGILVNYNSTDDSLKIINDIVPEWTVINSRNAEFDVHGVDNEITDIEKTIKGYKICLNTTEFLLCSKNINDILNNNVYRIKQFAVSDKNADSNPANLESFIDGLKFASLEKSYGHRFLHNLETNYGYTAGRHHFVYSNIHDTDEMHIAHCRFYPWNKSFIDRKLQIGKRIPEWQKLDGAGYQHLWNLETMEEKRAELNLYCSDITENYNIRKCFENHAKN
jgi:hypothetical protein